MLEFIKEKQDIWSRLQNTNKPIVIYGVGDGANKIIKACNLHNIKISDIFVSDNCNKKYNLDNFEVLKFSDIKTKYEDFIILLAFGVCCDNILDAIYQINNNYELLAPDVPVVGDGLFNYDYLIKNIEKINKVYNFLEDDLSKKVFIDNINFKLSGKIEYLKNITTDRNEVFKNIIRPCSNEVFVDLGAYNGDTVSEFINFCNNKYSKIIAVEPDFKNYIKLKNYIALNNITNIQTHNLAIWNKQETLFFSNNSSRSSMIQQDGIKVLADTVDNILNGEKVSIIKFDVEGAEKQAIEGAEKTIKKFLPKLLISAYHRNEDTFDLALQIKKINPSYKIYLRHHPYIPSWETNIYATVN